MQLIPGILTNFLINLLVKFYLNGIILIYILKLHFYFIIFGIRYRIITLCQSKYGGAIDALICATKYVHSCRQALILGIGGDGARTCPSFNLIQNFKGRY